MLDWLFGPGSNCYTDDYGAWPFLVLFVALGALLRWSGPVARAVADGFIGGAPSAGKRTIVRVQLVFLAGGGIVLGALALLGALPCD